MNTTHQLEWAVCSKCVCVRTTHIRGRVVIVNRFFHKLLKNQNKHFGGRFICADFDKPDGNTSSEMYALSAVITSHTMREYCRRCDYTHVCLLFRFPSFCIRFVFAVCASVVVVATAVAVVVGYDLRFNVFYSIIQDCILKFNVNA